MISRLVGGKMEKLSSLVKLSICALFTATFLSGCSIFGGGDKGPGNVEAAEEIFEIGVNAYLWRATTDTLSFMPILKTDQESGTILTDWMINPQNQQERTKADIFIVGSKLETNSLNVKIHRQQKSAGEWVSVQPRPGAELQLANAILLQARILRRDNAPIAQ